MIGEIIWFDTKIGYGYLFNETFGNLYFNIQDLQSNSKPQRGEKVSFEINSYESENRACNVILNRDKVICNKCNSRILPEISSKEIGTSIFPKCLSTIKYIDSYVVGFIFIYFTILILIYTSKY